jgi:LysM repeat protein
VVTETPAAEPTPTPTVSAPVAVATEIQEYRVEAGDSLNLIAARFGVSVSRIQEFNGISNPNLIRVGQLIRIPAPDSPATAPAPAPAPTPAPEPEPEPAPEVEYRVQSGDTLLRIGAKFGVSASLIQSHNGITNPRLIRVGQLIKIPTSAQTSAAAAEAAAPAPAPEPEPKTYRVASGDSLWGIARKFGVSSSALAALNGITNANLIRIGQLLQIPN